MFTLFNVFQDLKLSTYYFFSMYNYYLILSNAMFNAYNIDVYS